MTTAQLIRQTRITQVWKWLGGPEIRHGRSRAWWRKGDGLSVALDDKRNVWFDHRDSIGGGVLELIQHIRGGSRAQALRSLSAWLGLPLDGAQLSRADRRRYAQARQDAPELARVAEIWQRERRAELEEIKVAALERIDYHTLAWAASEAHLLGLLVPEGIVRAYRRACEVDSEHTAALVRGGEIWNRVAEALVTLLITRWCDDVVDIERSETDGGVTT